VDGREPDGLVVVGKQLILAIAVRADLNAPGVQDTIDVDQKDRTASCHMRMIALSVVPDRRADAPLADAP